MGSRVPKAGQIIYIETTDDAIGGKAVITKVLNVVSHGKPIIEVRVGLTPATTYNWTEYLASLQKELKNEFGARWAVRHDWPLHKGG